uniref:Uncharacterized protein n=1 Tax=Timema tahoe TaxID=61484 RepID=A0A7R9FHB6_9NEOP|nr:unnamed protein product [Timema tahoe]
MEGEWKTI